MKELSLALQVKEEGWWLVLGDENTQELHAIKRLSFSDRTTARLVFKGPPAEADAFSAMQLYLVRASLLAFPKVSVWIIMLV